MSATYCDVMKRKPTWRAVSFDWNFGVPGGENSPELRTAIITERQQFENMAKKLKFKIYPETTKLTRNLPKKKFFEELRKFKGLCVDECYGCILVAISSHGVILKTESGEEDVETYEDYILTHPDPDKEYSKDYVDERVTVREIVEVFRDLKGIPKIFFIQACRSKNKIPGKGGKDSKNIDVGIQFEVCDSEGVGQGKSGFFPPKPPENKIVYSPPCIDDSVIVFSTPLGYIAGSESRRGSHVWRVLEDKLDDILKDTPTPVKLLDLLKETNRELSQPEKKKHDKLTVKEVEYKPLLSICYTLTKHIVFEKNQDPST